MNILIATNSDYIKPVMVMLNSLFSNNKADVDVYIMQSKLKKNELFSLHHFVCMWGKAHSDNYVRRLFNIKFDHKAYQNISIQRKGLSIETFYRLDIAALLPNDIERILYLDGDIIVNRDIQRFYQSDFCNKAVIACKDYLLQKKYQNRSRIGLKRQDEYFNAGVLLINLPKYKEIVNGISVAAILDKGKHFEFYDQDILNILLEGEVRFAKTMKYNFMVDIAEIIESKEKKSSKPYIIHYAGNVKVKPWNYHCLLNEYKDIFWKYAISVYGKNVYRLFQIKNISYRVWRKISHVRVG